MRVLKRGRVDNSPVGTLNAADIGTARFIGLIPTEDEGGNLATQFRIRGRWASLAGGGSVDIRACLVTAGVKPSDGDPVGNALSGKMTWNGTDTDKITPVTGASPVSGSFSGVFFMTSRGTNDGEIIIPAAPHISLRVSNPSTAYSAGTVYIDDIEAIG